MKFAKMVLRCTAGPIVLILLNSCAGSKPTMIEPSRHNIRPMMKLIIETQEGQVYSIKVKRTNKHGIYGTNDEYIKYSEIKQLVKVPYSQSKILAVHGVVLGFVGIVVVVGLIKGPSFSSNFGLQ
ncbi:MAG: hypothetical protein ACRBF0_05260 [Calditrichia bacterium]